MSFINVPLNGPWNLRVVHAVDVDVVTNQNQVDQEKLEMIREILGYDYGSALTDDLKLRLKKNNLDVASQNQWKPV